MDADEIVHSLAIQRHLGPLDPSRPLCPRCGKETINFDRDDDWLPQLCGWCMLDRLAGIKDVKPLVFPARTRCNRCFQEKPLVGVWCFDCRDKSRWALITEYATRDPRHLDQIYFLRDYASSWSIWPKHRQELEAWGVWFDPPADSKSIAKAS